jgi:hypothetical protein
MGQSSPLADRPGMLAFTCGGEASALGSTSAVLGCARIASARVCQEVPARGQLQLAGWRSQRQEESDTEGIRTPAGRVQWISSPTP